MSAARACKASRQYPEKVRSESAAFGTLVAVSGRSASGVAVRPEPVTPQDRPVDFGCPHSSSQPKTAQFDEGRRAAMRMQPSGHSEQVGLPSGSPRAEN